MFDANFHPILGDNPLAQLETYRRQLEFFGISKALAVDLPGQNPHLSSVQYVEVVSQVEGFIPVPALRGDDPLGLESELNRLCVQGVRIVKIHPRKLGLSYASDVLRRILGLARETSMAILLCTYPYRRASAPGDLLHMATALDRMVPPEGLPPMILLHGGGPQLLDVCEWARHQSDLLVDLSFTITQLASSSVGLDIVNALERFEQRLVLGSDCPYEDLESFARARERFLVGVDPSSRESVMFGNLNQFVTKYLN